MLHCFEKVATGDRENHDAGVHKHVSHERKVEFLIDRMHERRKERHLCMRVCWLRIWNDALTYIPMWRETGAPG